MTNSFSAIASIFLFFQIATLFLLSNATFSLFALYRKKSHSDFPLSAKDTVTFLDKGGKHFFKIFLSPFLMWRIILTNHKDKELQSITKKVRLLLFLFVGSVIVEFILIIFTTPNLHFRWG